MKITKNQKLYFTLHLFPPFKNILIFHYYFTFHYYYIWLFLLGKKNRQEMLGLIHLFRVFLKQLYSETCIHQSNTFAVIIIPIVLHYYGTYGGPCAYFLFKIVIFSPQQLSNYFKFPVRIFCLSHFVVWDLLAQ